MLDDRKYGYKKTQLYILIFPRLLVHVDLYRQAEDRKDNKKTAYHSFISGDHEDACKKQQYRRKVTKPGFVHGNIFK